MSVVEIAYSFNPYSSGFSIYLPVKEEVPVTEELPVVPVSSPTYTLAEVQLAASTFARSSETAAQQIKDVLKATFGVGRISEIAEDRLVEFANALISLGAKL